MRNKKIKKCAEWLAYCLEIGWSKNDLDGLQELWMANHDDNGNYKAQLQQHSVMQAEGSDGAKGAAVGNSAAGQSGRDGVMKWCDSCGKITKWVDGDCENYKLRGGSAKEALPR